MSNRKENVYNRGSGSKNIRPRELPRTKCGPVNLNNTFAHIPGPRSIMKHEMSTIFVPVQPSVDYDLKCDIAYSNYLQALLLQHNASLQIKKHSLSLNDQLSKYADVLSKKQELVDELKQELKEINIKNIVKQLHNTLDARLSNNLKELPPDVECGLDKIVYVLQLAYNQLYLLKVKPLQCQTEYSNLQEHLSRCDKVMSKILNAIGDYQKYQNLRECLDHSQKLQKELAVIETSVKRLQTDTSKLTLESVSDILYENALNTKNASIL